MKVSEFKLWFDGLVSGLQANQSLTVGQLDALKKKVEALVDSSELKVSSVDKDTPKSGAPAQVDISKEQTGDGRSELEKAIDEIVRDQERRRKEDKDHPRIRPWTDPWNDPFRRLPQVPDFPIDDDPFGKRYPGPPIIYLSDRNENIGDWLDRLGFH